MILILSLTLIGMPAFAAQGRRGASDRAYQQASDESVFVRAGDWFATRGKTAEEKKAVLAERKTKRAKARMQKEVEKKKKMMEKEMKKRQKEMEARTKKMKKGMKK